MFKFVIGMIVGAALLIFLEHKALPKVGLWLSDKLAKKT